MSGLLSPAPKAAPLLLQKSSIAGYMGIGSMVLATFAQNGLPSNTVGWLQLGGGILASLAAIFTNPGGSVADTGIVRAP